MEGGEKTREREGGRGGGGGEGCEGARARVGERERERERGREGDRAPLGRSATELRLGVRPKKIAHNTRVTGLHLPVFLLDILQCGPRCGQTPYVCIYCVCVCERERVRQRERCMV
jgi:hypothetical protein